VIITVTSIRLRSVWYFFRLSLYGYRIQKQAVSENGFIKMKNTGFGYEHFTLSAWQSEADLKRFARSGEHSAAMKRTRELATEVKIYTYTADTLPSWPIAKQLLKEKAKVLKF